MKKKQKRIRTQRFHNSKKITAPRKQQVNVFTHMKTLGKVKTILDSNRQWQQSDKQWQLA